jgi:SNF2 family DNA or RNA helicase
MKLLDPQIPHSENLLNSLYLNGIAADLSETGCGKTYVATYVAKTMNVPVVVICPKAVIPVWKRVMASASGIGAWCQSTMKS